MTPPRIDRLRHPRIVPLELCDLEIAGSTLGSYRHATDFSTILRSGLMQVQSGAGRYCHGQVVSAAASGFTQVALGGGGALAIFNAWQQLHNPYVSTLIRDAEYLGVEGGLAQLPANDVVLDVGQTAVKIASAQQRQRFARDFSQLPDSGCSSADLATQRQQLRAYIGGALASFVHTQTNHPSALIVALPCEIADSQQLGGCSYYGMAGDTDLVADICALGAPTTLQIGLLNDAELAAYSVIQQLTPQQQAQKTLVITLGYGLGAAVLLPA